MKQSLSLAFVLAIGILITIANAGRMFDVSQRRGFTKNLVERSSSLQLHEQKAANTSDYRFYNNNTKPYFVESLPDVPQDLLTETYSGLIPIDKNNASRALFYVFQPRIGEPVDEITIWMNGGPGCSSLEGWLQENGYIQWTWGQYSPTANLYSWVNLTNMLWVEQPVGVGFSIGDVTATNEEDIAADFVSFFQNFEEIFGIKNFKIYVTGESYAGRYVPYISNAMLDKNDTEYFNLKGALVYDPCIGSYTYTNNAFVNKFVHDNNNVLGFNDTFISRLDKMHQTCGYADFVEQYLAFPPKGMQPAKYFNTTSEADCDTWDLVYDTAFATNPCFNVYEIGLQCPLLSDPLGYPTDLQFSYPGLPVYFNRSDVKEAMHAPMDVNWDECKGPVFVGDGGPEDEDDESPDPIQRVLPRVIEATNRVLVANGALDMDILTNGTLSSIQNMTWNGKMGFQSAPNKTIRITLPDLAYQALFLDQYGAPYDNPQGIMLNARLRFHIRKAASPLLSHSLVEIVLPRLHAIQSHISSHNGLEAPTAISNGFWVVSKNYSDEDQIDD